MTSCAYQRNALKNSSAATDDSSLHSGKNKIIRSDHPNNIKLRGACICYKEYLNVQNMATPYPEQCLLFKIKIQNQRFLVASLYRSSS